jgi:hypothetical protein
VMMSIFRIGHQRTTYSASLSLSVFGNFWQPERVCHNILANLRYNLTASASTLNTILHLTSVFLLSRMTIL